MHRRPSKSLLTKFFSDMIREEKVIVYLDDIIIASNNASEHLIILKEIFKRLVENKLELRLDKCEFLQSNVKYLGYNICGSGIKADEKGLETVKCFPVPGSVQEVQSFLGLCSYFRRFIKEFSIIAKPLYDLTRKDKQFVFGSKELTTFEILKEKLVTSPILAIYDPKHETELHCAASSIGFGAILLQRKNDKKFHPVFLLFEKNYKCLVEIPQL